MPAPSPTAARELPSAVLARILQRVPQQQRLLSCALVSKAWAASAAAASHSISLDLSKAADPNTVLPSFEAWLQQHGSNIGCLEVEWPHAGYQNMQLPCRALLQLTSLSLGRLVVTTSFEPQQSGQQEGMLADSAPALPQLVNLKLDSCKLSSPATLQLLAASPGLTALDLQQVWWEAEPSQQQSPAADASSSALAATLQACNRLQRLHLVFGGWRWKQEHNICMPSSSLSALSGLLQLQDLSLTDLRPTSSTAGALPALPISLTRLRLADGKLRLPEQAPDLTNLQALELERVPFKPRLLFGMTQLQRLELTFYGRVPTPAAAGTKRPFATLLAAIAALTQLRDLRVVVSGHMNVTGVQAQAFAGFTAASHLEVLHVELSIENTQPGEVPGRDVLQHMFPDARCLPQLHTLVLVASDVYRSWRVPGADLARIAASCPSLHTLSIRHMLQQGADLTPLLQFTGLKSLCVGGNGFDDSAAAVVAQLTQLTSLECDCSRHHLTREGLLQLTALTQLQELSLDRGELFVVEANWFDNLFTADSLPAHLTPSSEDGPMWLQLYRLLGVPEHVLDILQQRQVELEELQQLRSRNAELERQVQQARALGFLPGGCGEGAQG